jgi:uncharacterized protein
MRKSPFLVVLFFATLCANAQNAEIQIDKSNRTINVTVSDKTEELATRAHLEVGFTVIASDAQSAYASASVRSNAINKALLDAGVPKDHIQSLNQSLNRLEESSHKFEVSQNWTVEVDADAAANILQTAIAAGANDSGEIEWRVTDADALQAKATAKAMEHARSKAQSLASGMGVHLGAVLYVAEQTDSDNARSNLWNGVVGGVPGYRARQPLAIATRKVEKSATVTAVFAIE